MTDRTHLNKNLLRENLTFRIMSTSSNKNNGSLLPRGMGVLLCVLIYY